MSEIAGDELTFDQALQALERAVRELEDGQLSLEDCLARYEQGVGLIKRCYRQLSQAEQRILELTGADGNGQPTLTTFQHESTSPVSADPPRRPRRKSDDAG